MIDASHLIAAACLLILTTANAAANATCEQKFVRLLTDQSKKGPVKIFIIQEIKGGPASRNWHYNTGDGNWMTEMVEPANMQWTLMRDNVMYTSSNKGKSWQKLRAFDSSASMADVHKQQIENAKTAKNAKCGTDTLNGVAHETVEAEYEAVKYKTSHRAKYWINPADGWITKHTMTTKQAGFESFTTQMIERAPGLEIPSPQ